MFALQLLRRMRDQKRARQFEPNNEAEEPVESVKEPKKRRKSVKTLLNQLKKGKLTSKQVLEELRSNEYALSKKQYQALMDSGQSKFFDVKPQPTPANTPRRSPQGSPRNSPKSELVQREATKRETIETLLKSPETRAKLREGLSKSAKSGKPRKTWGQNQQAAAAARVMDTGKILKVQPRKTRSVAKRSGVTHAKLSQKGRVKAASQKPELDVQPAASLSFGDDE